MKLFPSVKSYVTTSGIFLKNNVSKICLGQFKNDIIEKELRKVSPYFIFGDNGSVIFNYCEMPKEAYKIVITENEINVFCSDCKSAFYAATTLKQLLKEDVICGEIFDAPDLETRGVMLDISRSKVPKLETLKLIVEKLAELKINHLELYVEGFSYEYKSFKEEVDINKNYIKFDDYLELEAYCNRYFIDLVPNQNGFGHMADWLAIDKYHHLAECPDGFYIWGADRPSSTLNPLNPGSLELVKKMYDDMLPYLKSHYFNMNFDEPFELGHGASKEEVEKNGEGNVYMDYFLKLYEHVRSYNKIPLMWGDIALKHPEVLSRFPKDAILVDWGYDHKYNYQGHAETLNNYGVKFMFAPATSTWASFVGKYIDMEGSIRNACKYAKEYGALGVLVTDWGDIGHLQYLPASLPGIAYAACNSWSTLDESDINEAVSYMIDDKTLASTIVELSHFSEYEGPYVGYGCRLFSTILWAEHSSRYPDSLSFFLEKMKYNLVDDLDNDKLKDFLIHIESNLDLVKESLITEELKASIYLIKTLCLFHKELHKYYNGEEVSLDHIISNLLNYKNIHYKLWLERNIEPGYYESVKRIDWLIMIIEKMNTERKLK